MQRKFVGTEPTSYFMYQLSTIIIIIIIIIIIWTANGFLPAGSVITIRLRN
jgi:hypothetical protein